MRKSWPNPVKTTSAALRSTGCREEVRGEADHSGDYLEVLAGDDEAETRAKVGDEMWADSGKCVVRPVEKNHRESGKVIFCSQR